MPVCCEGDIREPGGGWPRQKGLRDAGGHNRGGGTPVDDSKVLGHIKDLVEEEEKLYGKGHLTDSEKKHLGRMKVELDQCWDLLRQRRALRDAGKNPDDAKVRPPDIVENYEQ